jgi:hypothetical protein
MSLLRRRQDREPFDDSDPSLLRELATRSGDSRLTTQNLRARAEAWARARDLRVVDSVIALEHDGVAVRIPLVKLVPGLAVIEAMASSPVELEMSLEPRSRSWAESLLERFGGEGVDTDDTAFDARWSVKASDTVLARRLLDAERRQTLLGCEHWCRVTYRSGRIEVLVDAERMAGTHLLDGIEIATHFATARLATSAYR